MDAYVAILDHYPSNTLRYVGNVIEPREDESPVALIQRLYNEYLDPSRKLYYVGSTIPVPEEELRLTVINGKPGVERLYAGNHTGTKQPLFHIDMFITLAGRGPDGRYRVLVGDPGQAAKLLGMPLWQHSMKQVYDNIAKTLSNLGFEVLRNPLPLVYLDEQGQDEWPQEVPAPRLSWREDAEAQGASARMRTSRRVAVPESMRRLSFPRTSPFRWK